MIIPFLNKQTADVKRKVLFKNVQYSTHTHSDTIPTNILKEVLIFHTLQGILYTNENDHFIWRVCSVVRPFFLVNFFLLYEFF